MKNFVQEGRTITATAAADISGGDGMLFGSLFGVACHDALTDAEVEIQVEGVFDLAKSADGGSAVTAGGKVYWDDDNGVVTGAASGNVLIGTAMAAAADAVAVARVRLGGTPDEFVGGVGAVVADLTEDSGAIGGTNDGDLPDLTATAATLTEDSGEIGGTNDGDLPDLTATAATLTENAGAIGGTNDGDLPDLSSPDAAGNAAAVRELAAMLNAVIADNVALRAAVQENAAMLNAVIADNVALRAAAREDAAKTNALLAQLRAAGVIASA